MMRGNLVRSTYCPADNVGVNRMLSAGYFAAWIPEQSGVNPLRSATPAHTEQKCPAGEKLARMGAFRASRRPARPIGRQEVAHQLAQQVAQSPTYPGQGRDVLVLTFDTSACIHVSNFDNRT